MLDKYWCLRRLHERRKDEVIVTCMSTAMPWAELSDGPLDFASVDSAMGHAADFAYGLAIAQPERRVIVLNGDGSMLMCLGTMVTMAQRPVPNFSMVICENGTYEVTGNQSVPGADKIDYAALALASGLMQATAVESENDFENHLDALFAGEGPQVFIWKIAPTDEGVPRPSRPILERARSLRQALVEA